MNTLSWLLYAADIAGSISAALSMTAFIGAGAAVACSIIWVSTGSPPTVYSYENGEEKLARHDAYRAKVSGLIRPAIYIFLGCALVASVIPGRDTIYAIAASEMGEEVVKSETAGKAMKALNAWLDRQIEGETTDAS